MMLHPMRGPPPNYGAGRNPYQGQRPQQQQEQRYFHPQQVPSNGPDPCRAGDGHYAEELEEQRPRARGHREYRHGYEAHYVEDYGNQHVDQQEDDTYYNEYRYGTEGVDAADAYHYEDLT